MNFDIEKQAESQFNDIYKLIEYLLKQTEKFDADYLQNYYWKITKKESRKAIMSCLPIIKRMIHSNEKNSFCTSKNITKLTMFMNKCQISQIDKTMFEFLKVNKKTIYTMYFKESYENEITKHI